MSDAPILAIGLTGVNRGDSIPSVTLTNGDGMAKSQALKPRMIQADDDRWKAVRDSAWRERVSMSEWVRTAIDERLEYDRARKARRKRAS